ncbi:MAG: hypothetical protein ACRDIY_21810, partial [Chloroflexota bacterium]
MHHTGILIFGLLLLIVALSFGPGVAGLVLLGTIVVSSGLVAGLWVIDYRSDDARADRAVRAGRIGDAIRYYMRCRT